MGKSLSCSYEVSYNQSKILADVAKDPMNSMNDKISSSIERAKGFSQIVENAISAVLKKVEVFSNGLGDLGEGKGHEVNSLLQVEVVFTAEK